MLLASGPTAPRREECILLQLQVCDAGVNQAHRLQTQVSLRQGRERTEHNGGIDQATKGRCTESVLRRTRYALDAIEF